VFYFDQGGTLTERFGLEVTPARIRQEDLKLRITEFPLDDTVIPEPLANPEASP